MPVHVEEMNMEVQVADGDLPLTEAQIDKLVKIVLSRLEHKQHESNRSREATTLRTQAAPTLHISD